MAVVFSQKNDNVLRIIKINYADLQTKDAEGLILYLNNVAGFVKKSNESVLLHVETNEFTTPKIEMKYALASKRRGTYGYGGVLLTEDDITLIEKNIIELTSSDESIKIENNDLVVNTDGWQLDSDLNNLTSNIQI